MKAYVHGPLGYVKTLKLQLRVGDLDLPERRGIPVVDRRKKHRCALVAKQQTRTHTEEECEIYKEGRDALKDMKKIDECDMDKFGTLDRKRALSYEIDGHRRRHRRGEDKQIVSVLYGKNLMSAQKLEVCLLGE